MATMADPMVFIPAVTGAMGLWALVMGRGIGDLPRWPWRGTALRAAGAYCLLDSLAVVALALTGRDGLAFVTYAASALAFAALAILTCRRAVPS